MYSNPAWEWFHTRGMCAQSSDYNILSFYNSLYDIIDFQLCIWTLWLLIYVVPLISFIEVQSITIVAFNIYIIGFLAPIPAPCLYFRHEYIRVFSFDEIILFPAVFMLLLRSVFTPLKKELSTLFFWNNFICVLICTGCISLITGRSNLQMVAFTDLAALFCYIYATWTPFYMRVVESVVLLVLLCIYTDGSVKFEYAYRLSFIGTITNLLIPLVFLSVEKNNIRLILQILFKPVAILKNNKKKDASLLSITLSSPFLYGACEITLLIPLLLGMYFYKKTYKDDIIIL